MQYSIHRVFLMLGSKCNLQCKYCLQHEMATPSNKLVSSDVVDWLRQVIRTQNKKLNITFYGGEPLIYWDAIKQVVNALGDSASYGIITNGKLLDEDKIDFINDNNISVTLSWDGKNVHNTRGYDALKSNPFISNVRKLSLSAVLSAENYPLDFLDAAEPFMESYRNEHGSYPSLNIDTIMDFGNCADLANVDCAKVSSQMSTVMQGAKPIYQFFRDSFMKYVFRQESEIKLAPCKNGIKVWNVDTEGNLYRCHNTGECIGTIYDDMLIPLVNGIRLDTTLDNYKACKKCPVYKLCSGGCPLVTAEDRVRYYCSIKQAYYIPILEYIDGESEKGRVIVIE